MNPLVSILVVSQTPSLARECLAGVAEATDAAATPYELLLLHNGVEPQTPLSHAGDFVREHRVGLNLGFAEGNNYLARMARGEYLVFLNDDAVPQTGWLERLVAAVTRPGVGAAGSRILFPDGTLQEAGGIVWSDGSTRPLGRGEPPGSFAFTYVRDVDYVSANGLILARSSFETLGGFSDRYFPAYYEDVDLCLGVRHRLQMRIVYEPRSVLLHREAASTADTDFRSFLFRRNQERLRGAWTSELSTYAAPAPDSPVAVEEAVLRRRAATARVLVIDDRIPDRAFGSGFGRARQMFEELNEPRFAVALHPTDLGNPPRANDLADLGVDVVMEPLDEHLARAENRYDAVVISRPHNVQAHLETVRRRLPDARIVIDVEALYHRRLELQTELERDPARKAALRAETDAMRELERSSACAADRLVSISTTEAQWLRGIPGHAVVDYVHPFDATVEMLPVDLPKRDSVVFVAGWLGGDDSPNALALRWFVEDIVPHVVPFVPDLRVVVTGGNPPPSVRALQSKHLELVGRVGDLRDVYARARAAISPILVGAGVKIKTIEALQAGVPVVATTLGAEGMDLREGAEIDVADDPMEFAHRLVALIVDDELWSERRRAIDAIVAQWRDAQVRWPDVIDKTLASARVATGQA